MRYGTRRIVRLNPGARALLVLIGSGIITLSWVMPWYDVTIFMRTARAFHATTGLGHFPALASLTGQDDLTRKYGQYMLHREYSGGDLVHGGPGLAALGMPQYYYQLSLALTIVGLIAWQVARRGGDGTLALGLRRMADVTMGLGLMYLVAVAAIKTLHMRSLTTVADAATAELTYDLARRSAGAHPIAYASAGFSSGLIAVLLGLVVASFGILAGDRSEPSETILGTDVSSIALVRIGTTLIANVLTVLGIVYLALSVVFFI
ncbi:hypothetical protein AGRA3207_007321 [Actinomadura graeca]|uniref:Uncharacterized protein n=1 Tax=Actinomadura graeca TaxID=2750812 RepID=A0ABX8R3W6_9ACTN|nr:hypothetical protein [Actinomadura graeca]QXJ25771.1 hypothetical protein AGRA3207_007321 [Actinomadura graeca]